jgi:hypothetical protein
MGAKSKYSDRYKKKNHKHALARKNTCFECGSTSHFANVCPIRAQQRKEMGLPSDADNSDNAGDGEEEEEGAAFADESSKFGILGRVEQDEAFSEQCKEPVQEGGKSEYELERERKIAENNAMLAALGLGPAASGNASVDSSDDDEINPKVGSHEDTKEDEEEDADEQQKSAANIGRAKVRARKSNTKKSSRAKPTINSSRPSDRAATTSTQARASGRRKKGATPQYVHNDSGSDYTANGAESDGSAGFDGDGVDADGADYDEDEDEDGDVDGDGEGEGDCGAGVSKHKGDAQSTSFDFALDVGDDSNSTGGSKKKMVRIINGVAVVTGGDGTPTPTPSRTKSKGNSGKKKAASAAKRSRPNSGTRASATNRNKGGKEEGFPSDVANESLSADASKRGKGKAKATAADAGASSKAVYTLSRLYRGLNVAELKAELKERKLPVSGKKSELISRLLEADAEDRDDGSGGQRADDAMSFLGLAPGAADPFAWTIPDQEQGHEQEEQQEQEREQQQQQQQREARKEQARLQQQQTRQKLAQQQQQQQLPDETSHTQAVVALESRMAAELLTTAPLSATDSSKVACKGEAAASTAELSAATDANISAAMVEDDAQSEEEVRTGTRTEDCVAADEEDVDPFAGESLDAILAMCDAAAAPKPKDGGGAVHEAFTEAVLTSQLKELCGYSSFRNQQLEAMQRVLSGQSTLLILPTGSGKSLCMVHVF